MARTRILAIATLVASSVTVYAGDPARKAFVDSWRGRRVEIRKTMLTLVYNERGKIGKVYHDRRDGLTVITPSAGSYLQFDGRDGEQDIIARDPQQVIDRINESYRRSEALDVGFYLRVEPQVVMRYEPGGAVIVKDVKVERSRVRLGLVSLASDAPADQIATALTVQWPTEFSTMFTERPLVEDLIRQFVDDRAEKTTTARE
jgi:hypothetical protein